MELLRVYSWHEWHVESPGSETISRFRQQGTMPLLSYGLCFRLRTAGSTHKIGLAQRSPVVDLMNVFHILWPPGFTSNSAIFFHRKIVRANGHRRRNRTTWAKRSCHCVRVYRAEIVSHVRSSLVFAPSRTLTLPGSGSFTFLLTVVEHSFETLKRACSNIPTTSKFRRQCLMPRNF